MTTTDPSWNCLETIYATDLVYVPDCWKLCGDAHCCNFARHKSKFRVMARTHSQEIPLLPGEFEYMNSKGWLAQFGDFVHNVVKYELPSVTLRTESIISRRPNCACDHATRPLICRLYPLMPVFDLAGRCIGTERLGIYEELEDLAQQVTACELRSLPFEQMTDFLTITTALGSVPTFLYYLEAYRLTKAHVRERVAAAMGEDRNAFATFEALFRRRRAVDHSFLKPQLETLYQTFASRFGASFVEAMNGTTTAA